MTPQRTRTLLVPHCRSALSVSTGHIPKHTADALAKGVEERESKDPESLWHVLAYEPWDKYGWIISTAAEDPDQNEPVGHPELAALLKFARRLGIDYLQLDCDANILHPELGFPTFEW